MIIKKRKISLIDIAFGIYVFTHVCIGSTMITNGSLLLFTGLVFFSKKTSRLSLYSILEILFIIYHLIHILFGITVLQDVAFDDLTKVISIFLVNYCYYDYCREKKDINIILDIYLLSSFLGFSLLFLTYGTQLSTRAGGEMATVSILGILISGGVSTKIGMGSAIGFFLSFVRYYKRSNIVLFLYSTIFMITAFFSGTRKVLLILVLAVIIIPIIREKKITKQTRNIIFSFILIIIIYEIMIRMPSINVTIIRRLKNLASYIVTGTGDSSAGVRKLLIEKAKNGFQQRKIMGWGLENFRQLFDAGRYHCHNNYWEMLVSGGVIGFCIYYSKYVLCIREFVKKQLKHKSNDYMICFALLFAIMLVMEYWQRTYNQRNIALIYMMFYSILRSPNEEKV